MKPGCRSASPAVTFILITVVLDRLSFRIIIPVLHRLGEDWDPAQAATIATCIGPQADGQLPGAP